MPGGGIDRGETPSQAAAREMREEIGISVLPEGLIASIQPNYVYAGRRDPVQFFTLTCERAPEIVIDKREIVEARWVPLDEARQLQVAPHIRDCLETV